MHGLKRGLVTLSSVGAAGALVWAAGRFGTDGDGGYWASVGVVFAAGLLLALAQVYARRREPVRPTFSGWAFLIGFLPAAVVGGWIVVSGMPHGMVAHNVQAWSGDLGVRGGVDQLARLARLIALGVGVALGFCFDVPEAVERPEPLYEIAPQDVRNLSFHDGGIPDPAREKPRTLTG